MTTILSATLGVILISLVLLDAFETVVFPRRVTRRLRLTRVFYRYSWLLWSSVIMSAFSGRRRENLLSVYGPMSLPILMGFWASAWSPRKGSGQKVPAAGSGERHF